MSSGFHSMTLQKSKEFITQQAQACFEAQS